MSKSLADYLSEVRRVIPVGQVLSDPHATATAPINDSVDLSKYRPVTPQEQAVIAAMLNGDGPELSFSAAEAKLPSCTTAWRISHSSRVVFTW